MTHGFTSSTTMRLARSVAIAGLIGLWTGAACAQSDTRETTVGQAARIEQIVIPAPELQVRPIDSEAALVVRIVNVFPHGSDFRYDLEYYGLEPGEYNLIDALQEADGSAAERDPITVRVTSVLPAGQVLPNELETGTLPSIGGYGLLLTLGGIAWVVGLLLIVFWGRGKFGDAPEQNRPPLTLAARLRPLLEDAMSGRLPPEKHSELELTLVAWWRRHLNMDDLPAAEAISRLRGHEQAGPLLRQLESWLHQPADRREQTDLGELLKPYEAMPASALDAPGRVGAAS